MKNALAGSLFLAGPGAILVCIIVACFMKGLITEWTWGNALVYGSIVCATDPVAVVAVLKNAG